MDYSLKFLGASVSDIKMSIGNTIDATQIQLELVEDIANGDSFTTGIIGHPYEVSYGDITIRGLLQNYIKNMSPQGSPIYTVRLTSPSKILDGVSLILSDFRESVSGIPNIFNIYGYYEDTFGYGGSYVNDLGMVWSGENFTVTYVTGFEDSRSSNGMYGIKPGIESLQTGSNLNFGNTIEYRDQKYLLDLSEIPNIDSYWRYGGANGSATLSEVIEGVCSDYGHDWFSEISNINTSTDTHTIKIRTVDRTSPRLDGQIEQYALTKSGYSSLQIGKEANYDQTNLFMIGANLEEYHQQATPGSILPFWGFNLDGTPAVGAGVDDAYEVNVNSIEISDILAAVLLEFPALSSSYVPNQYTYTISVAELRCALAGQDVWTAFMLQYKLLLALSINICSASAPYDSSHPVDGYRFPHDFITQSPYFANIISNANFNSNFFVYMNRFYNFVLSYARDWYGKRWMVKTPTLISFKIEPDTGRILYDWEPIDSVFVETGSQPLGIDLIYEADFKDDSYRWKPLVKFDNASFIDPTTLRHRNIVVNNNSIFTNCKIMQDVGIIYIGAESYVVIELDNPAYYYSNDVLGGVNTIKDLFSLINLDWTVYRNDTPLKYGPAAAVPAAVALPMRSNSISYGPWQTNGIAGATLYRKEDGLAPWNYGGHLYMNLAASGFINDFVRSSQVEENGSIQFAGFPDRSIGDEIMAGGSIITDVQISISPNGVTTSYQMKSHTQRPGSSSKLRSERLARLGQDQLRFSRNAINSSRRYRNQIENNGGGIGNGSFQWNDRLSRLVKQETPYGCLVGHVASLPSGKSISLVSAQTFAESIQNISYTGTFIDTACVSYDAIFRPFSVDTEYVGSIPSYYGSLSGFNQALKQEDITDWRSPNNIEWYLHGNEYSGVHSRKSQADPSKARVLGIKTPQDFIGYGYDIWGFPVPNKSGITYPQDLSTEYASGYKINSSLHIPAPLDVRYDPIRGVWGQPGVLGGILDGDVLPGQSGVLALYYEGEVKPYRVPFINDSIKTTLTSGHYTKIGFDYLVNSYVVINQECEESEIPILPI